MKIRILWFLIGAASASAFWLLVLNNLESQWFRALFELGG